jgi:hypothetical protein
MVSAVQAYLRFLLKIIRIFTLNSGVMPKVDYFIVTKIKFQSGIV